MQMDFQDWIGSGRYHRLIRRDQKPVRRTTTRQVWMKKVHGNGSVKGVKLSRSRNLNWKPFSTMFMLSRKIGKMCSGIVERTKVEEACPAIIFSCQWGLPVLSHSSRNTSAADASYRTFSCL